MTATTSVSVVVATRDRPTLLARCLAALDAQTLEPVEVVVVDDASRDRATVAAVVARAPRARLVRGEGRGPAAARNLGAAAARGTVLAFTDDDCAPVPDWLAELVPVVECADAAAGPTRAPAGAAAVVRASQTIASYLAEATMEPATGRMRFAPTSNLAGRASTFVQLPFDERFASAAGEDREWCARLQDRGGVLRFAPGAVVHHHQQLTLRTFWRQQRRYGGGAQRFHRAGRGLAAPSFYTGLVRAGSAHGPLVGALVLLAQVATSVGYLEGAFEQRRARPPLSRA
ncbi:MAG: glycosyltransferase [Egibacteraceae bacterium]